MRNKTLLFFILVSVPFFLSAQQKEAIDTGTASGVIKDSVHNYVLPAATLAVYLESDTSLLNYQLSDKSGEFSYRNLPVGVPLLIVATYVGYTPLTRHFTIPAEAKKIDLGTLNMNMSENTLEEVVVIAEPPVRMNGDTLEFNADAFKLDPNAVVEDLMRKLPGVTVWGDGVITVNGRKVNSVLVEGKPFFGGNMKVATQNIPKAAVEKIQVYKKNENDDTRDSTMEVNIRLKEHMRKGYFGKTMAGYGSDTRYQADGSFNVFTPKTQVSLVGASNNVNKTAGSVDDFLDNSTFKGVGASVDHYPDFFRQGITRQHSGGVRITHDFLDHLMPAKTHEIQGEFLISQTSPVQNRKTRTMINTGNDAARIQNTSSASDSRSSRQHLSTRYDLGTKSRRFYIAPQLDIQDNRTLSFNESNISEAENSIETFSTALQDRTKRSNSLSFATGYLHNLDAGPAYQIDYYLSANNRDEDFRTKTRFSSLYDSAKNRYYNRIYHDRENEQLHVIEFRLQKLNQLLYQPEGNGFLFDLQADLHIERIEQDRIVNDIDSAAQSPGLNAYLSNKSLYRSVNFLPALVVQRSFSRSLHGRFQKTLTFKLDLKGQFFNQKNASLKEFQLFSKNAATLLPAASIVYRNQQFDTYDATYSLRYISSTSFPAVDQLVPLVDSINGWYFHYGNPDLKPSYKQEISFNNTYFSASANNHFNYTIGINAGTIRDHLTDSTLYDTIGRSIHYIVNASGNRYLRGYGEVNKSYKRNDHQWQVSLNADYGFSRNPSFVNGEKHLVNNIKGAAALTILYTYQDFLAIRLTQANSFFRSRRKQTNNSYEFKNFGTSLGLSASVNCTRKLTLSSNLRYDDNSSTGIENKGFIIWNASVGYRFLEGNNLELKLSFLDLLRQNTGIINYGLNNSITTGTVNVLQQYGLISLAFYPRKFGLPGRKGNSE